MRDATTIAKARSIVLGAGIESIRWISYYTDEVYVYHLQCLDAEGRPLHLSAAEHAAAAILTESATTAAYDPAARQAFPSLTIETSDDESLMYRDIDAGRLFTTPLVVTFEDQNWLADATPFVYEHDGWGSGFDPTGERFGTTPRYRAHDDHTFRYVVDDPDEDPEDTGDGDESVPHIAASPEGGR